MLKGDSYYNAEQLLQLPDNGQRYELVRGELRTMAPAGARHGRVAHTLGRLLGNHVQQLGLGTVYAAETGFLIARDPDTVRAPDVAFLDRHRALQFAEETGFLLCAPDLAGEVISPDDTFSEVEEKALSRLAAGTRLVLLVDPGTRRVHLYRRPDQIVVLDEQAECDVSDVVRDWRFSVRALFE